MRGRIREVRNFWLEYEGNDGMGKKMGPKGVNGGFRLGVYVKGEDGESKKVGILSGISNEGRLGLVWCDEKDGEVVLRLYEGRVGDRDGSRKLIEEKENLL